MTQSDLSFRKISSNEKNEIAGVGVGGGWEKDQSTLEPSPSALRKVMIGGRGQREEGRFKGDLPGRRDKKELTEHRGRKETE